MVGDLTSVELGKLINVRGSDSKWVVRGRLARVSHHVRDDGSVWSRLWIKLYDDAPLVKFEVGSEHIAELLPDR